MPDWKIAHCLDHRKDRGDDAAPTVTTGVYVQSQHLEKYEVLCAWEEVLLEIVGERDTLTYADTEMCLTA